MLERRLDQAKQGFRCQRCFARKELKAWSPDIFLCKSCVYELSKVMDFFEYWGYELTRREELDLPLKVSPPLPALEKPGSLEDSAQRALASSSQPSGNGGVSAGRGHRGV